MRHVAADARSDMIQKTTTVYGDDRLAPAPLDPACRMCVIIPARDERDEIAGAIEALANQCDVDGNPLDFACFEVVTLANNCADDTAERARSAGARFPLLRLHVVECHYDAGESRVGVARRALMDDAARRFREAGRPLGVIASTDADTRVAPDWVARTLSAIDAGADAVGGRILVARSSLDATDERAWAHHLRDVGYRMLATELRARLDPTPHDPWPRHFQHFGPSLAVTASVYERVGGLPPLGSLEDVALFRAMRRADARVRHDPSVRVVTSARPSRRTPWGFAAQLREWSGMEGAGSRAAVPQAGAIEAFALARRDVRWAWRAAGSSGAGVAQLTRAASLLALDADLLRDLTRDAPTFGCLIEAVVAAMDADGRWSSRWPLVDIGQAIEDLRVRLSALRARPVIAAPEYIDAVALSAAAG